MKKIYLFFALEKGETLVLVHPGIPTIFISYIICFSKLSTLSAVTSFHLYLQKIDIILLNIINFCKFIIKDALVLGVVGHRDHTPLYSCGNLHFNGFEDLENLK